MKVNKEYFIENFFGYSKKYFPVSFLEQRTLNSCIRCSGTGRTSREELTDYHKREYDTFYDDCDICSGEGRVIQTKISMSFGDVGYKPNMKTDRLRNITVEKFVEPYTKEGAKDIERQSFRHVFNFPVESLSENVLSR